jgi:NAD-dependent deacetylase
MTPSSDQWEIAVTWLRSARRIVAFTGAGLSAESGIATFRDEGGIWQNFPPETFACWNGLIRTAVRQPARLGAFLIAVLEPISIAMPNQAHLALAELERFLPTVVVTQNVDGLHHDAGSTLIREVHGSFLEVVTWRGRLVRRMTRHDLRQIVERLRRAQRGVCRLARVVLALRQFVGLSWQGIIRPNVILFGEGLAEPDWTLARRDAGRCDLMIVTGTSALVWPAAELPSRVRDKGARVIIIDPAEPSTSGLWIPGSASTVLPALVRQAFTGNVTG